MIGELCIPLMSCPPTRHLSFHKDLILVSTTVGYFLSVVTCYLRSVAVSVAHAQCHMDELAVHSATLSQFAQLSRCPCW